MFTQLQLASFVKRHDNVSHISEQQLDSSLLSAHLKLLERLNSSPPKRDIYNETPACADLWTVLDDVYQAFDTH